MTNRKYIFAQEETGSSWLYHQNYSIFIIRRKFYSLKVAIMAEKAFLICKSTAQISYNIKF